MNISQLTDQFRTFEELKVFCDSQFRQILNLTKKNKELEDQLKESKKVPLEINNLPALVQSPTSLAIAGAKPLEDAEIIAHVQLRLLKDLSLTKELNTDEAKRVEIFNRILKLPDEKNKPIPASSRSIPDAELLKAVDGNN